VNKIKAYSKESLSFLIFSKMKVSYLLNSLTASARFTGVAPGSPGIQVSPQDFFHTEEASRSVETLSLIHEALFNRTADLSPSGPVAQHLLRAAQAHANCGNQLFNVHQPRRSAGTSDSFRFKRS
jgi:hypothetical protein